MCVCVIVPYFLCWMHGQICINEQKENVYAIAHEFGKYFLDWQKVAPRTIRQDMKRIFFVSENMHSSSARANTFNYTARHILFLIVHVISYI